MQHTPKLNLNKPEATDYVNIEDLNENADIIDAEVSDVKDKADHVEQDLSEYKADYTQHVEDEDIHLQLGERAKWNNSVDVLTGLKTVKLNKDDNDIFTTVEKYRKSTGTLYQRAVLSGGESPNYTTRTITTYDLDGSTILKTDVYTLSYDDDGILVGEE